MTDEEKHAWTEIIKTALEEYKENERKKERHKAVGWKICESILVVAIVGLIFYFVIWRVLVPLKTGGTTTIATYIQEGYSEISGVSSFYDVLQDILTLAVAVGFPCFARLRNIWAQNRQETIESISLIISIAGLLLALLKFEFFSR